jgi:hypothetical protein
MDATRPTQARESANSVFWIMLGIFPSLRAFSKFADAFANEITN